MTAVDPRPPLQVQTAIIKSMFSVHKFHTHAKESFKVTQNVFDTFVFFNCVPTLIVHD